MLHHPHKHVHRRQEPKLEFIDHVVKFFMVATPLFELPQAIAIYSSRSAEHVSVITWCFFTLSSLIWLIYGFKHKVLPIMVANSLYMIVELAIVIGIVLYS